MTTGLHRDISRIDFTTEKVRDTEWRADPKPWTKYPERKLTSSAESHLIYHYGRTLGPGRYADVGTYRGGTAAALGHGLQDAGSYARIYAVDYYSPIAQNSNSCPNADIPEKLSAYFKAHLPRVDLEICVGETSEWGRLFDQPLRFVFIDADHSYEGCKADVEAWSRLVEPGGVMAFHDTDFDSVNAVLDELPPCWKLEHHIFRTKAFRRV